MLRIFVFQEPTSVKLRLEGTLTDESVPVLLERWAEVRPRLNGRMAILDLGDVTELDASALSTLGWLARAGVQLGYAHPNVRSVIDNLAWEVSGVPRFAARVWRRLHLATGDAYWDSVCRLLRFLLPAAWRPCGYRTS